MVERMGAGGNHKLASMVNVLGGADDAVLDRWWTRLLEDKERAIFVAPSETDVPDKKVREVFLPVL